MNDEESDDEILKKFKKPMDVSPNIMGRRVNDPNLDLSKVLATQKKKMSTNMSSAKGSPLKNSKFNQKKGSLI